MYIYSNIRFFSRESEKALTGGDLVRQLMFPT